MGVQGTELRGPLKAAISAATPSLYPLLHILGKRFITALHPQPSQLIFLTANLA